MSEQKLSIGTRGIVVQPREGTVSSFTPGRSITIKLPCGATGDSIMLFEETVPLDVIFRPWGFRSNEIRSQPTR